MALFGDVPEFYAVKCDLTVPFCILVFTRSKVGLVKARLWWILVKETIRDLVSCCLSVVVGTTALARPPLPSFITGLPAKEHCQLNRSADMFVRYCWLIGVSIS